MENKNKFLSHLALKCAVAAAVLVASSLASADQFGVQIAGGLADHHARPVIEHDPASDFGGRMDFDARQPS